MNYELTESEEVEVFEKRKSYPIFKAEMYNWLISLGMHPIEAIERIDNFDSLTNEEQEEVLQDWQNTIYPKVLPPRL